MVPKRHGVSWDFNYSTKDLQYKASEDTPPLDVHQLYVYATHQQSNLFHKNTELSAWRKNERECEDKKKNKVEY